MLKFGSGAATSLVIFSFFSFVPPKALVLIVMGLTPFVALAVPQRIAPDIERDGQAFLAGLIGGAMQLVSGVTGPLLDIFYVRTGMTRQVNVATKAAAQVLGHLTKVAYFGVVIEARPAATSSSGWSWPMPPASRCSAPPCHAVSSTVCRTGSSTIGRAA